MSALMNLLRKLLRQPSGASERGASTIDKPDVQQEALPPIAGNAYGQRAVFELLKTVSDSGLPVREIADRTGMTWDNADEKLKKLKGLGYVEEVPGSSPRHWRLTHDGRAAA